MNENKKIWKKYGAGLCRHTLSAETQNSRRVCKNESMENYGDLHGIYMANKWVLINDNDEGARKRWRKRKLLATLNWVESWQISSHISP